MSILIERCSSVIASTKKYTVVALAGVADAMMPINPDRTNADSLTQHPHSQRRMLQLSSA